MNAYFATQEGGAVEGKAIYTMNAKNKLFAIPQNEIDLYGGKLKQNDGF